MGWIDLINLGLNATQAIQLHNTQKTLSQMQLGAVMESQKKEIIEAVRNLVFSTMQSAKALEQKLPGAPVQVYILSSVLKWRLESFGIRYEVLPDISDKEYLTQTNSKLDSNRSASSTQLDPVQINEANSCIKYIEEMPLLDEAIGWRSAQDQLVQMNSPWQKLQSKRNLYMLGGAAALFGGPILGGILSLVSSVGMSTGSEILGMIASLTCMTSFLFFLVVPFIGLAFLLFVKPTGFDTLKKTRDILLKKANDREMEQAVIGTFGNLELDGYQALKNSREQALSNIFGEKVDIDKLLIDAV